ncbi:hypothetical protein ON010_g4821 [Phytophthora cinnamomi]|nr:hypothetical protein ON010_g4821 [Phytophthora cinnamomi]
MRLAIRPESTSTFPRKPHIICSYYEQHQSPRRRSLEAGVRIRSKEKNIKPNFISVLKEKIVADTAAHIANTAFCGSIDTSIGSGKEEDKLHLAKEASDSADVAEDNFGGVMGICLPMCIPKAYIPAGVPGTDRPVVHSVSGAKRSRSSPVTISAESVASASSATSTLTQPLQPLQLLQPLQPLQL